MELGFVGAQVLGTMLPGHAMGPAGLVESLPQVRRPEAYGVGRGEGGLTKEWGL